MNAINDVYKNNKNFKKSVIENICENQTGFINPVLVTFQNGNLNDKYGSEFEVLLHSKSNFGTEVEIKSSYGYSYKNSNRNCSPGLKKFIAVRNNKTNKVRIIEVNHLILINAALDRSKNLNISESDYAKDIKALNKSFGGKKIVSRIEQRERINVNPDLIAHEVNETIAGIKLETAESLSGTEAESLTNLLPPCHRDAKILSEVYVLNEILSSDELEVLKEVSGKIESKNEKYSDFFWYCVKEAKKSRENLNERLAGILYIEILIQFLKIPPKKLHSKNVVLCTFPSIIVLKLLNEFCIKTESSICRPLMMKDKAACHIIAICLLCCNYEINLKLLATVSAINFNRLSRLARHVGAIPASKEQQTFLLKIPLPTIANLKRKTK